MRYEYIEPFVSSTLRVLDRVFQSDIAKGDCTLVRGSEITDDVAIVVRIKGQSEGSIILNMPTDTARRISSLMYGEEFETLTPEGLDSISELANMIAGNAATVLNNRGCDFRLLPPVVLLKEEMKAVPPETEAFQVPLFTDCGEITMNVAMTTL